jgi:hypothetical protein
VERPRISAELVVDWDKVVTVSEARGQFEAYVRSVRSREAQVAGYIVQIEGQLFACGNNAEWWRDYWQAIDKRTG